MATKTILRWACGATMAIVAGGCGRTPIQDCGAAGPVSFQRPSTSLPCQKEGPGVLLIESQEDWDAHCGGGVPKVDFSRDTLIGYFLEDGCKYSGCTDEVPLITTMTKHGCTLVIETSDVTIGDLGACHACLHPHDFVVVARDDAMGAIDVEGP